MPVLVTAADSPLGARLVTRLLGTGGEVRAFATGGGADLPGGAFVATGDLLDEGHLEAAMEQAHTVIHLGAGLVATSPDGLVEEAATVVTAALGAGVRRLIALSVAGAGPGAGDPLRRAFGRVEELVAEAPVPSVALRTSLPDLPEVTEALSVAPLTGEHLNALVAPVRGDDVVELLAAFDAARSRAEEGHAVFAAEGPERMSLGDYLERAGVEPPGRVGRLVGRVWRPPGQLTPFLQALPGPWVSREDWVPDAFAFAGLEPRAVG